MTTIAWVAAACAFMVGGLSPLLVRPLLSKLRVLDVPSERSSHSVPVLRGGGLAPLLGVLVGLSIVVARQPQLFNVAVIGLAGGVVAALGLLEDLRGVRIVVRAAVQMAVGSAASSALVLHSDADLWWIPVGAVVFAGYTNAANFMDGINAISGLHGAAVGSIFAVIGILTDRSWLLAVGLVVAVSFASFLPWNLARRRMFLGDVGSYLLGGALGITALAAVLDGAPPLAVIAPLSVYIADTAVTLFRRVRRGEQWQQPHRSHTYQRLTDTGLTHLNSAAIVTTSTLLVSVLGLISISGSVESIVVAGAGIAIVLAVYLSLPRILNPAGGSQVAPIAARPMLPESHLSGHSAPVRWVVVGGSGFIGSALVAELELQGFLAVSVPAPRLAMKPNATSTEAFAQLAHNSKAVASLTAAMIGADVVVNAAGLAAPDAATSEALFGANALLPAAMLRAAESAQVYRLIHLSSAAVQGRRTVLDETASTAPFSPYSKSKALGESVLLAGIEEMKNRDLPEVVILRATSVQGAGRPTTGRLRRLAQSPAASVAYPGDRPTVVSSVKGLVEFVARVGAHKGSVPIIVLQPWEGLTTSSVLEVAGGKSPRRLPKTLCRALISAGYAFGAAVPQIRGHVRRVELMWLGQGQNAAWAKSVGLEKNSYVADVFGDARERVH